LRCTTGAHRSAIGAFKPVAGVAAETGGASKHISATIGPLIGSLSVVRKGVVQRKVTASPARLALRSVTVSGNFRDGGNGGPGLAHPAKSARANAAVTTPAHRLWQFGIQPEAIAIARRFSQIQNLSRNVHLLTRLEHLLTG
jgi:hypothetical protein